MRSLVLLVSLLISNLVFSQEIERVPLDYPLTALIKPNDAFLIDKDRLYLFGGDIIAVFDDDLNLIGNIYKNSNSTEMRYANAQYGLVFNNSFSESAYFSRLEITQTLFNDDENYESIKLSEDALYLYRLESVMDNGNGESRVGSEIIQTILPPEGYKYDVRIKPCVYSTNSGNYIAIPTNNQYVYIYYKINKKGTSSISRGALISSNTSEIKYYDMSGKILNNPVKGINIVKYEDGTIKKKVYK